MALQAHHVAVEAKEEAIEREGRLSRRIGLCQELLQDQQASGSSTTAHISSGGGQNIISNMVKEMVPVLVELDCRINRHQDPQAPGRRINRHQEAAQQHTSAVCRDT